MLTLSTKKEKRTKKERNDCCYSFQFFLSSLRGALHLCQDLKWVCLPCGDSRSAVTQGHRSHALSRRIDKELTLAALRMGIETRQPVRGCIHHSDRGVQYAAHEYVDVLREHGFQISMSRKGNVYDNATAESFMKTYKYEEVYLSEYEIFGDVLQNTPRFIDDVYNAKRLHSSIGYVPPNEFEDTWNEMNRAARRKTNLEHVAKEVMD